MNSGDWYLTYGDYAMVVGIALIVVGLAVFGYMVFWVTFGRRHDRELRKYDAYFDAVMNELDEEIKNGKRTRND